MLNDALRPQKKPVAAFLRQYLRQEAADRLSTDRGMHAQNLRRATFPAWTEGSQVIKRIDARAVAVMPAHFDCVISDRPDFH